MTLIESCVESLKIWVSSQRINSQEKKLPKSDFVKMRVHPHSHRWQIKMSSDPRTFLPYYRWSKEKLYRS
jgi:hypothetical protein